MSSRNSSRWSGKNSRTWSTSAASSRSFVFAPITEDVFETINGEIGSRREAIDRHGLYRAKLARARRLVSSRDLAGAKRWAAEGADTEPENREARELEIRIYARLERYTEAMTLYREAVERFPDMAAGLEELRLELRHGEQARQKAEQRQAELSRQRERALEHQRISTSKKPLPVLDGDEAIAPKTLAAKHEPVEPAYSWSGVAGEFLLDHWQKLILCMAVLLIVVSSTVGAHLLLGDGSGRPQASALWRWWQRSCSPVWARCSSAGERTARAR